LHLACPAHAKAFCPDWRLRHADRGFGNWIRVEAMTPKFIQLLEQCITDGVILGHTRAYKHNDAPSKSDINEAIVREVLNELHEWFDFDETKEKQA
jgi:hypothetical protein